MGYRESGPEEVDASDIIDLIEGRIGGAEAAQVRAGIQASPRAAFLHQWLVEFVQRTRRLVIDDPSPELRDRLLALAAQLPDPPPSPIELGVARVLAALRFDSWAFLANEPAFRGAPGSTDILSPDRQRHLLFEADELDIAIDIYWDGDQVEVLGQVLADSDEQPLLAVVRRTGESVPVELSATAEFRITLDRDEFIHLRVHVDDAVVEIGPLDPGEPAGDAL